MKLTVNIKNAPSKVDRPYIVVRFCAGELWYYGQYDDVERANDVAEGLGMATVFDNSSYNAIKALEQESVILEQEPCIEPLERLAESASKTAKVLERLKVSEQEPSNVMEHDKDHIWYKGGQYISLRRFLEVKAEAEQEPIEVEATKLQMAYNQGFEDCRKAVLEAMYELCDEGGTLKENPWRDNPHIDAITDAINNLPPVNPQEPRYCDRNMCIKNEYNGIGCDECEVTKSQEPKIGHWIYDKTIENWRCSKCNETPKTMGYVGTVDFMAEHFKFCNHCGCRMVEPQESEVRNEKR